jgi:predicted peptidase
LTRRSVLTWGLGSVAVAVGAAGTGVELVEHEILPGHTLLDRVDGACDVSVPARSFGPVGPSFEETSFSRARNRMVHYSISYPPGHGPGSELPLIVALHGSGGNHHDALGGMTAAQGLALRTDGALLPPMAVLAPDGDSTYWHAHPGDDPMRMILDELLPLCRARGLRHHPVGAMGISMGGYGALLLAEKHPEIFTAAAAISPAVWRSYPEAHAANPGAYADATDFAANDVITHVRALDGTPVRVASGRDDPFRAGVLALTRVLPQHAVVDISKGCHTGSFFAEQQVPSLQFLAAHLS